MFTYNLPHGLNTNTYVTPEGNIKFDPHLFEQRYMTAIHIIEDKRWKRPLKKIVDFGCSEMSLLPLLRRIPHVEHILEVDIDSELLRLNLRKSVPLVADYLKKRENPLRVDVLEGSITDPVEQLYDVDVVIGIEIIEHLHKEILEKVPENVFGFIQPSLAIFSTPNSDYNVLFTQLLENGFRHYDHKFEWSRKEFEQWCLLICKNYPNYSVSFMGLGNPPDGREELGHATQVAIFARNDMIDKPLSTEISKKPITTDAEYKVISSVNFPYNEDKRCKEQIILDDFNYFIFQSKSSPKYFYEKSSMYQIPWKNFLRHEQRFSLTEAELLKILNGTNFKIVGSYIIIPDEDEDTASDDLQDDEEYSLEAPLNDEEDEKLASKLASSCSVVTGDNDTEECWD